MASGFLRLTFTSRSSPTSTLRNLKVVDLSTSDQTFGNQSLIFANLSASAYQSLGYRQGGLVLSLTNISYIE